MIYLLMPGTSVTYYGEEINMDNTFVTWEQTQDPQGCNAGPEYYQRFSRDPQRTPFQWNDQPFAGIFKLTRKKKCKLNNKTKRFHERKFNLAACERELRHS
jgi:alpha-glucosidase